MIGVIYPVHSEALGPFSREPIGLRTIIGKRIVDRLVESLHKAGIDTVLVLYGNADVPGAIVLEEDEISEYISPSDLVLSLPDNLVASEFLVGILKGLKEKEEEVYLASTSAKSPWIVESALGSLYFLGISVCKGTFSKACGKPIITSLEAAFIQEPKDFLDALDVALKDIKETRISSNAKIYSDVILEGPVVIDDGAIIYERTKIIGPAYIGKGVLIGNSCLIRRAAINAGSTVGFSSEIKHSVIEENVSTGRISYIGDSFIGRNTTIIGGIVTVNYKPGYKKLGAFISPGKRIAGFRSFEYYTVL